MAIIPPTRRLKPSENYSLLTLETYAPGDYVAPFLVDGSTVVSNIFIQEIAPGASVEISYWDYTYTGVSTEYQLASHLPLTLIGNNRIPVNLIRNSPEVRVKVIGGDIKFSVNVVVLQSFVSEVDANLRNDGDLWVAADMGQPVMGLDRVTGQYRYVNVNNGAMLVEFAATNQIINKRLYNSQLAAVPNAENVTINYTVPVGKKFTWLAGVGASDAPCEWRVFIDTLPVLTSRSSYDDRNVQLSLGDKVALTAGQILKVSCYNKTIRNSNSEIETWIYAYEENV